MPPILNNASPCIECKKHESYIKTLEKTIVSLQNKIESLQNKIDCITSENNQLRNNTEINSLLGEIENQDEKKLFEDALEKLNIINEKINKRK